MTEIRSATPVVSLSSKRTEIKLISSTQKHTTYTSQIKLGDQNKTWEPQIICKSCKESLQLWMKGNRTGMVWHEPVNHFDDCYFCIANLVGFNKKNRRNIL